MKNHIYKFTNKSDFEYTYKDFNFRTKNEEEDSYNDFRAKGNQFSRCKIILRDLV